MHKQASTTILSLLISLFTGASLSAAFDPPSAGKKTIVLSENTSEYNIGIDEVNYYVVEANSMTIDEVQENLDKFIYSDKVGFYGFNNQKDAWFHFTIKNSSSIHDWTFWVHDVTIRELEIFVEDPSGGFQRHYSGMDQIIEERPIPSFLYLFHLNALPDRETQVFLRVQKKAYMNLFFILAPSSRFSEYHVKLQTLMGFYVGIVVMMLVINLGAYVFTREPNFLLYIFAMLYNDLILLNSIQLDFLFAPDFSRWFIEVKSLFPPLIVILIFARKILSIDESNRYLYKIYKYLPLILVFFELARPFYHPEFFRIIQSYVAIITFPILIFTSIYTFYEKKDKISFMAILAWGPYFSWAIYIYAMKIGLIEGDYEAMYITFLFSMVEHLMMSIMALSKWADERKIVNKTKKERDLYKLKTYQNRLKPHFLYNSLNTIHAMTTTGNSKTAGEAILRLAEVYRYIQDEAMKEAVTLKTEIRFVINFLSFMKERKGEGLTFKIDSPDNLDALSIPPMIIQPLVENSIKHGMKDHDKMEIEVQCKEFGDQGCVCVVQDSGSGIQDLDITSPTFIGIYERLQFLYESVSIESGSASPQGAKITLTFEKPKNRGGKDDKKE